MRWWKPNRKSPVRVGACSDVGRVRTENQDAYGCFPAGEEAGERLFVVADGMGGHAHGREASHLAVEVIREVYFAGRRGPAGERLRRALEQANARVYARAQQGSTGPERMGTTCTALVLDGEHAHMAHVGDSRAYRIDARGIRQLTRDHTFVNELVGQGILTPDEAQHHPRRHALTRALGIQPTLQVDVLENLPVQERQTFVLCTDGLAPVSEAEIREVVEALPPQEASEKLVRMANERGGPDNVTVLVVAVG
ncbi:Stp1/IreP family PP2C-type Ser/Thr phosphatase [Rhodocaloribacter litoris]|uniref:Stp1/IreP family PP2C-type Ser/Thr phosphatase n=1 Tax=Rhodocaloribacter litoris TaxID=2558931 RepID=UPI001422CEC2|nr:Stp1/IreP family PP2C-type Ser/Thr phosphatase [Rhodocaloribacter litoris]QXD13885.1 Stp1/IreP family PP2C-type Ser/Thr phosphatase [Rhodocaloribacter litoris]GIV60322.1 MAG: hypothetical protein KatS3mg043_1411 [Rhodothermaceae bacterium]